MRRSLEGLEGKRALLIAGPTASGKSAAAERLAQGAAALGLNAWIVNADSMQVYDALRVLTARPGEAEEARAPHRLYGHVPASTRYSVAAWLNDAEAVLRAVRREGALAIVVGGTGLYFKALTEGLAATPSVPPEIREAWLERLRADGAAALHAELDKLDAPAARSIRPNDSRRILRALEVLEATGRPLAEWREAQGSPTLARADVVRLVLEPDRRKLYLRIEQRFDRMVRAGAVQEVRALLERGLDPTLPVMKAIGVREFGAYLRGEIGLSEAVERAKMETRRYAKRQMTWFRHQMAGWERAGP